MRKEPDWAKQGVIAAWAIGVPVIILAAVAYLFPPDPAHPIRLGFLMRPATIPAWQIGVGGAAIIWLSALVWRWRNAPRQPTRSEAAAERTIGELSEKLAKADFDQKGAQKKIAARELEERTLQQKALPRHVAELIGAQENLKKDEPPPLLADGSNEFIATSEDGFFIRITRHEDNQTKGLMLGIENRCLGAIAPYRLRILSARSFDTGHQQYRDNGNFKAFAGKTTKPTQPSCTGENTWLVRKISDSPHLQAGNSSGCEMEWPNADRSPVQRWLLKIDVATQTVPKAGELAVPLRTIEFDLPMAWNPEKNEFFIDQPAGVSS